MKRRTVVVLGLVLSSALCMAATVYLISVGARIDTQTTPLSPGQTFLSGGALLVGVMGLAVFLGLALRPADAVAGGQSAGARAGGEESPARHDRASRIRASGD